MTPRTPAHHVEGKPVVIEAVASHRNGVFGAPFDVVTFSHDDRAMVAILFDYDRDEGLDRTAVFDLSLLAQGEIAFGRNSWRGDVYAPVLRRLVARRARRR